VAPVSARTLLIIILAVLLILAATGGIHPGK
jgi:hypothetical protein